jgi:hypothetical protein
MSFKEVKSQLIDLYLCIKVRKSEDIEDLNKDIIIEEKKALENLPLSDIMNYIKNSIDVLVEIKTFNKLQEKLEKDEEKNNYINNEDKNDLNGLKLYEGMLINTEKKIREHIRVRILKFIFPRFLA